MTYDEIAVQMPDEYAARAANKLVGKKIMQMKKLTLENNFLSILEISLSTRRKLLRCHAKIRTSFI